MTATVYELIATTISGYSKEKSQMWKKSCLRMKSQIKNFYLKACFDFLFCEDGLEYGGGEEISEERFLKMEEEKFSEILQSQINIFDKICFACRYLSDSNLKLFLEKLKLDCLEAANLEAIILNGLTSHSSFLLLQRYLDFTSDIQTVSLLAAHILSNSPSSLPHHRILNQWILLYHFSFFSTFFF